MTFYSLYRHTAKIGDYKDDYIFKTQSADSGKVSIKNQHLGTVDNLDNGLLIGIAKDTPRKNNRRQVLYYQKQEAKADGTIEMTMKIPPAGTTWTIFDKSSTLRSYAPFRKQDTTESIPFLTLHSLPTKKDKEVVISKEVKVKAG